MKSQWAIAVCLALSACSAPDQHGAANENAATSTMIENVAPMEVGFPEGPYFEGICDRGVPAAPFMSFAGTSFMYGTPVPVRVAGEYLEVVAPDGAAASTRFEETKATIFRNLSIEVVGQSQPGQFSFESWTAEYGISDFPFFPENQLKYQRAIGAEFPMLPLSSLEVSRNPAENFDLNFVSVMNVLRSGSAEPDLPNARIPTSEQISDLRMRATGVSFVRDASVFNTIESTLDGRAFAGQLHIGILERWLVIQIDNERRVLVAIDLDRDQIAIRQC